MYVQFHLYWHVLDRRSIHLGEAKLLTLVSNLHFAISKSTPIFHVFLFNPLILQRYPP